MDPDVSLYPLPVLLVSFCEGQRVAVVPGIGVEASSGTEDQRSLGLQRYPLSHTAHQCWHRCGCRRPCQGIALLLIPTVLLLLLGLGSYLLLLNHVLIPSGKPDLLDLLRSEDEDVEEERELTENTTLPWVLIMPTGMTDTPPSTFSIQETIAVSVLAPGTTLSLASSSPTPSSTPPPLGKCPTPLLAFIFFLLCNNMQYHCLNSLCDVSEMIVRGQDQAHQLCSRKKGKGREK